MSEEKFWVVWDSCYAPSKKHLNCEDAKTEARRLARKHPDKAFAVLEAVFVVRAMETPLEEHELGSEWKSAQSGDRVLKPNSSKNGGMENAK